MTPKGHFDAVWLRCDGLSAMHAYLANQATAVLPTDELLRAEWVARVSALDLYVHELVAQRMVQCFEGALPKTPQFLSFQLPVETVERIRTATSPVAASAAFELEVRRQLAFITYQDPERIAEGVRMCSSAELWNGIALHQGANASTKNAQAKQLKNQLKAIVDRRNKIAHEGDLQPILPITPWPIAQVDLQMVATFIQRLVDSIESCV